MKTKKYIPPLPPVEKVYPSYAQALQLLEETKANDPAALSRPFTDQLDAILVVCVELGRRNP